MVDEINIKKIRIVKSPEILYGGKILKLFCPSDFSGVVLPTCDLLVPSGLNVEELTLDYLIHSYAGYTYPSDDSEIGREAGNRLLIMSPWIHNDELYIHLINLGETELKVLPEKTIGYICFTKIEKLNICIGR